MDKKDVKRNLFDHSSAKVRLLSEYLKRYLNIIANDPYTERIKIYDLFCGEGLYDNGGEGSPLAIMRCVKDLHFANVAKLSRIVPIDCHFNDIEGKKVQKLKSAIKDKSLHYDKFGDLSFSSDDYKNQVDNLKKLLPTLHKQKVFVFIDPYEYKHISASDIKSLLSQKHSEVLLFLPTQFMYRFDKKGTPQALKDFIEEIVEYKKWRENENNSSWDFVNQLKEAFREYLGVHHFVDTFTIEKDQNTVFSLFFFTSHIKGFEKMLEAKWEIDTEQGKGWNYTGNPPSLFHAFKTNPLEEKLKVFLRGKQRTNGDAYEFTLRAGFLPKHANEVFYNWQNNGNLEVVTRNGERARKGSFYIAYNYYRDDCNKVSFRLK
ncbi:MAG: three-Cys-motif partner protein TcmP [Ignavibacteriae bacterium]|nr:three-Cys-motif partner protein TcmP [Ignavibacteriota bacterium]